MSSSAHAARTRPLSLFRHAVDAALFCAAPALLAVAAPALGQDAAGPAAKNAVALQVGALGLGVEYSHSFGDRLALRGALYGSQTGFDGNEGDIDYEFDVIWDSLALGIDIHPGAGPFRLSGGYLRNDNRIEAVSAPTGIEEIGDSFYTPSQIGTLNGLVTFDDAALFAGLGWDWSRDGGFGMSLDLGVVSQGDPFVDLQATGTAASAPAFQQDLAAEEEEIRAELEDLDVVPYLTLGFVFRF
jgi:hypothetical protein